MGAESPDQRAGKKICIVGPSKRFFSGLTIRTIYLANALSERNDVSVLLLREIAPRFLYPGREHVGKDYFTVDFKPGIKVFDGMDYHSPYSWYKGYKFLHDVKPEVIIIMWWSAIVAHMQLLVKGIARAKLNAKIILEMHEITDPLEHSILPIRSYSKGVAKLITRNLDAYTTLSESARDIFIQAFSVKKEKTFVIPLTLYDHYGPPVTQAEAKQKLGIKEDFVIGYFGVIRKYKGVSYLIDAFNLLPEDIARNCRLLVAGEIWEGKGELLKQIEASKYQARITLIPRYISDEEVPTCFSAMSLVSLPYLRPVTSGVVQIAKSYGKPIVISDVDGMRGYMSDYQDVTYVPAADAQGIAREILNAYQNTHTPGLRQTAAQSMDLVAQKYESLISTLTG